MNKFHILGSVALAFSLFFTLGSAATQAQDGSEFAGGNGTEENPWQIATKQQLAVLNNYIGDAGKGKFFLLTQDLDFTDDFSRSGDFYNDGKFWEPIGNGWEDSSFQGTFDGGNHEIIGLRVNTDAAGLFRYIQRATIKNLTVSYGKVKGDFGFGGISCYASESLIENCHIKSDEDGIMTTARYYTPSGGLIGYVEARQCYVIDSSFEGNLKNEDGGAIGGIVGGGTRGALLATIFNSFVEGDISAQGNNAGGMIGAGCANIQNSYVKGNINGGSNAGGLIGLAHDDYSVPITIEKSYFQGNITGYIVGGLIGSGNAGPYQVDINITTSYAEGKFQGKKSVGGLIGFICGTHDAKKGHCISESYSKGEIEILSGESGDSFPVSAGGLVGTVFENEQFDFVIENCYSHCNILVSSRYSVSAGGLVGYQYSRGHAAHSSKVGIQNSYAMGSIKADQSVQSSISGNHAYLGGLISSPLLENDYEHTFASVQRCVAMNPSLTAPHGDIEDTGRIGIFGNGDLNNNYALDTMMLKISNKDVSLTGSANDKNGLAKTATELAQQSTYTGLGWNFNKIWKMSVNGYPIFKWQEDTPIATAPTITSQPVSQTVNVGDSVTFSVTATGTEPLNYQWYKGSSLISGATSSTYQINSVKNSDAGSYYVIVSNTIGSATSSVATLTVNAPASAPVIVTQPVSQTVDVGQNVRFSVVVTGTEPLNYQWLKNGATIPGATSSSYTISSAKMEDAGNYMVIVSNSVGMAVSNPATLTVKDPAIPPVIIVQPKSQEVLIGESVTFSVTATGTEPLSYQWLFNGNPIPGATSSTYSISQVTEANEGNYSVIVSNVAGTAISSTAVLTVKILPPVIVMHPQTLIIMKGSTVTFAVIAEGSGLSYQWTFNGKDIAGANQPVYVIPAAEAGNVGSYAVKVSNKAGSVTSQSAMLWLNNLQMYAGVEVYGPVGAKFTVWYKDDAESGEWKKLTTSTVSASPTVVIDYDSPKNTKRFYKVEIE